MSYFVKNLANGWNTLRDVILKEKMNFKVIY